MNAVHLVGRLVRDPDFKVSSSGKEICNFTLAVRNPHKDNGNGADFPQCVAFGAVATIIADYNRQGDQIGVSGTLRTRSYQTDNGETRYVTEVLVDTVTLIGGRRGAGEGETEPFPEAGNQRSGSGKNHNGGNKNRSGGGNRSGGNRGNR